MVRSLRHFVLALAVLSAASAALLFAQVTQAHDAVPPHVHSVEFTSEGPYMEGDSIEVTVTFSEPVYDTVASVTSEITLLVDASELATPEAPNPNPLSAASQTMTFTYIVRAGDADGTVHVQENSLDGDARYLRNANGEYVGQNPQHAGVDGGDEHYIDHTAPTLDTVAVTTDGPYGIGST